MPLYEYLCPNDGRITIRHSMLEVDTSHTCPQCGADVTRVVSTPHHWWPSNFRPGNENSGQRMFLDPEFQARNKDKLAEMKANRNE